MSDFNNSGDGTGSAAVRLLPPRMSRSQPQLATKYAPGSMFTWEGGKGACMAVPLESATTVDFSGGRLGRRDQILETLREFCQNWHSRGMNINRPTTIPVYDVQTLDSCFFNPVRSKIEVGIEQFEFLRPDKIGYIPGPLVWRCETCERIKEYLSTAHQIADPLPEICGDPAQGRSCRWRQLDVVYVHWSGSLEGLSPFRYTMDANRVVQKIPRCLCGSDEFRLLKKGPHFSRWRFKCSGCGTDREVYQTDPFSLALLKGEMDRGVPHTWSEINMIPVSYRASPTFYPQAARFIVYELETDTTNLLLPGQQQALLDKIALIHGYAGHGPTDQQIKEQLEAKGRAAQWKSYARMREKEATARASGDEETAHTLGEFAQDTLKNWYETGDITPPAAATPELASQVAVRPQFAKRFDPFRATIEHDALRRHKVGVAAEAANLRLAQADLCAEWGDTDLQAAYARRVDGAVERAGIQDLFLIRHLDMVEFSFGFTRVSATPVTTQKDREMPVRLMGFPALPNDKRPIYVIEQQNEAIYVRLDAGHVAEFLIRNQAISVAPQPPRSLGSLVLEQYQDFGPYLQDFSSRDQVTRSRDASSLVYLLLHSMAHHVMHGIAQFSGLELSSLSEAIYPADFAFIVHRRGMTEDLGNISSMWRDHNAAFLNYLVARRDLRCGSGSLCDHRGGACPACIMIPETSCIAGNQLLSRAVLAGGSACPWDVNSTELAGYFEIVAGATAGGAT